MLVKSDGKKEEAIINQLIDSDEQLKRQHEIFKAEMEFKQALIDARKANSLTQKQVSERSGLSQQAISRLEKGKGGTLETIIRYLNSIGGTLSAKLENK